MDPYNNAQPNNFQGMPNSRGPAFPYINKGINEVKGYYDPYTEYASNPEDFMSRIMESFKQNPGQLKSNELRMNAMDNTAASQGRSLSPNHMRDQGDLAGALYNQDMQQYIDNIFKQQGLSLQAAQGASGDIGNLYGSAGTAAHQDDIQKRSDKSALTSAIIQALGTAAGGALGGPPGAAAGAGLSQWLKKLFSPGASDQEEGYGFNNPGYSNLNSSYNTKWMDF